MLMNQGRICNEKDIRSISNLFSISWMFANEITRKSRMAERTTEPLYTDTELEMANNTCIGKVTDALNSKDKTSLLELFSENALNDISENNYDDQIESLFQYIDTTITAYEIYTPEPASEKKTEFGKVSLKLFGLYKRDYEEKSVNNNLL